MKATFIGTGMGIALLAMAGMSVSFAFADSTSTATSTATTTEVTSTSTATTTVDTATSTATTTDSTSTTTEDSSSSSSSSSTSGGSSISSLLATLQSLLAQVHALQQQIFGVKSQVRTLLNTDYQMGSSSPDIQKIQELLASDPSVYPQGLTTGYFGNLTEDALKRFQAKNGLPVTGELDTATKALLQEYLNQASSTIPNGFLSNGRVRSEVEKSFAAHCHEMEYGDGQYCGHMQAQIAKHEYENTGSSTASSSPSSDFWSWWTPFLNKEHGNSDHGNSNNDHGNGHGNSDHGNSNDQGSASSSSSSDN